MDRDKTLHLLSLNWTAEPILSSDWSVSLKLCSDWLGGPLTDEFQKWRQTDRHTNKVNLIDCWTATFAVKKIFIWMNNSKYRVVILKYIIWIEKKIFPIIWSNKKSKVFLLYLHTLQKKSQTFLIYLKWYVIWNEKENTKTYKLNSWFQPTADLILSSDWLVSLKLCSDWLGEPFTDEFQKWRHTNKQTNKHTHKLIW